MELPEVATAARLSLRPGDRLVLTVRRRLSDQDYDNLSAHVKTWGLPDDVKAIILDDGTSVEVLAREDGS